ncbi:hypothetical protein CRUP_015681, partial [Coryphaenoides rupestris]
QILFTEQQLSVKCTKLQEVKVSVARCEDKIKASNEKHIKNSQELHNKTQQLSEMKLQHDVMKKQEQQTERQLKELLRQQAHLKEHLMEQEKHKNGAMNTMLEENKALLLQHQELEKANKELDRHITEAKAVTESLRAESMMVSLKPQTDSTCLRSEEKLEREPNLRSKRFSVEIPDRNTLELYSEMEHLNQIEDMAAVSERELQ